MGLAFVYYNLTNIWPFSLLNKIDDIKASNQLVQKLLIPEQTKQFVYAVQEPETDSIIYVLCVQNLSERSAEDAVCLIKAVRPDAVVAQLGNYEVPEIQADGKGDVGGTVPTTVVEVVKRCFLENLDKEKYESTAGALVLKEIFGVGFHGHFIAAKNAAKEIGSSFLVLESPFVKVMASGNVPPVGSDAGVKHGRLVSNLVSQKAGSIAGNLVNSFDRFSVKSETQLSMVRLMSTYMDASILNLSPGRQNTTQTIQPKSDYMPPPFAQSIYPLLTDLNAMFCDLPSIGQALASAQKVFDGVDKGEPVDSKVLYNVYTFRIAIEVLRMALNTAGRVPINQSKHNFAFSQLSDDEKSHAVLAQALRCQSSKYKSTVAVVDAQCLEGLRRYWNTVLPADVKNVVGEFVASYEDYGNASNEGDKKRLLSSNPVLAVGVGASAVVGASSLSKAVPVSTFIKLLSFKTPLASLQVMALESQRAFGIALSQMLGPFKVVAPGLAGSGTKSASTIKAFVGAKKIRAITHSVIASAEKTSFSAMRGAFYHIMRSRAIRPVGILPWVTFGCSMATCVGLVAYGDGLECAAEALPVASSIANLGRGVQSLHQAAEQTERSSLQKSLEAMMYRLKKAKFQINQEKISLTE